MRKSTFRVKTLRNKFFKNPWKYSATTPGSTLKNKEREDGLKEHLVWEKCEKVGVKKKGVQSKEER